MSKRFTGYHMFGILVAFFGTVIAVNFTMAGLATSTFGGIVVENSYVASQKFNDWLDAAEAQGELGWEANTTWLEDRRLLVSATGPGSGATLTATARHPLGRAPDRALAFDRMSDGSFLSRQELPAGRWILRLVMSDGSNEWRREEVLP